MADIEEIQGEYYQPGLSKVAVSGTGSFLCSNTSNTKPVLIGGVLKSDNLEYFSAECPKPVRDAFYHNDSG